MESPAVKDPQIPDEIVSDTSNSQINDRSETPDSSRGQQDNDSVTSSPKISKPVLGKAQAKKRLMAFAKFNASVKQSLEKLKEKNQTAAKDSELQKIKLDDSKESQDSTKISKPEELRDLSQGNDGEPVKLQNSPKKMKKRSEKKLAAIEEIMREESKQKQLISIESLEKTVNYAKFQLRHQAEQRNRDFNKRYRDNRAFRNNWDDKRRFHSRFNDRKSPFNRQSDNRHGQFSGQSDQSKRSPFDRRRKNSSERRDDRNRDRKDQRRSKSNDDEQNLKIKNGEKIDGDIENNKNDRRRKKWNRNERNSYSEQGGNWGHFKNQGHWNKGKLLEKDPPRAPPVELKSKSAQEYRNNWEQMLMVSNTRPQRSCAIVNGIDDCQREYPPESIRVTRRFNKGPMFYAENPNFSMTWNRRRLYQVLPPDRCRLMREISDAQAQNLETYEAPKIRNWYKRIDSNGKLEIVKRTTFFGNNTADGLTDGCNPNVCSIPPKSRWEVESEELHVPADEAEVADEKLDEKSELDDEKSTLEEGEISRDDTVDDGKEENVIEHDEKVPGELVSEYEEFMKIVSTEPESSVAQKESFIPETSWSTHPSEFTETKPNRSARDDDFEEKKNVEDAPEIQDTSSKQTDKTGSLCSMDSVENIPHNDKIIVGEEEYSRRTEPPEDLVVYQEKPKKHVIEKAKSKSSKNSRKKKQRKRVSSTDSSDSSSSSDSETEKRKRQKKRKRKKKRARASSTDSSSSEDSSSEGKISKKRRKSSKRRKKEKKAKLRKKRARRDSSDSETSDSTEREERLRKRKRKKRNLAKHSKASKRHRSRSSEKIKFRKIKIEVEDEDIPLEKSPIKPSGEVTHASPEAEKIVIKVERERTPSSIFEQEAGEIEEVVKETSNSPVMQLEKDKVSVWEKETLASTDPENLATIPIPEGAHPSEILKPEEIPLPSSPKESTENSSSLQKAPEEEKTVEKNESEAVTCKKQRKLEKKRRSISISSTSSSDSTSSYSSSSSSSSSSKTSVKHKKKHYSMKSRSDHSHNRRKNASKGIRRSKSKWVTEFDFDFPSLTQLEQGVLPAEKVGTLIDDWEVDSLEDIRDFASSYIKEKSKKPKKVEKEVRYDEKTDTYIAVEKASLPENKKKPFGRVCALRIWEDEEEEAERDALLIEKTIEPSNSIEPWQSEPIIPVPPIELNKEDESKSTDFSTPQEPEEKNDDEGWMEASTEVVKSSESSPKVDDTRWKKKKTPEPSICQDPPTPEGPLVPVNWEEEEEWTSSLTTSLEVKPVQPSIDTTQLKTQLEIEKSEKLETKEIDAKPEVEKKTEIIAPDDKDKLYSPSSAADSQKSEEVSSDSSDSSSDSSSTSGSLESETESSRGERGKVKESIENAQRPSSPSPVPPPELDEFSIEKAENECADETIQKLKMDMLLKVAGKDLTTIENEDSSTISLQLEQVSSKIPGSEEASSSSLNDLSIKDDSSKPKEIFRNTFVEITPQVSRSPDRKKVSSKESDKVKQRISEERTSNSSYRSSSHSRSTPKDSEKFKFDDRGNRRDRSTSPRAERRRFNSPVGRRFSEKRGGSSPSWHRRHSRSRSRSWSRSRSRTPDRRDRQKRFKYPEERRDRFSRSPLRSRVFNRGRRSHERDWNLETPTDKTYDPLELLRGGKKVRECDPSKKLLSEIAPREGNESQDLYENRLPNELNFNDRNYQDSLEREIMEGPIPADAEPRTRYRKDLSGDGRSRDAGWDRRESPERFGNRKRSLERRPRSRLSPRSRRSPRRSEKGRFLSRSRSRSWTRSRSRSRTRSRSFTRSRSRSRSSSRSRSTTRLRSVDRNRRKSRSRSFSPRRRRRDDIRYRRSNSRDRVRQIETIVHPSGMNPLPEESSNTMMNEPNQAASPFRYQDSTEDYPFYPRNNLTYPPRVEESSGSPKRLSLDDRLELELGIKKQESNAIPYPPPFAPHMMPPSSPVPIPMRVPGPPGFHRPPTVVQVGNVLQVVPRDFQPTGVPPVSGIRPDLPLVPIPPSANGNRVLRVGNVLQVVPTTTLDWTESGPPPVSIERQPIPPYPPPPVPAVIPIGPVPSVAVSPHPLPVPVPQVPATPVVTPSAVPPKPPPIPQPVYNYEAIMEVRRKEKEERRRLREERRAEKERRRIIKMRKKAEKVLEKVNQLTAAAEQDVPEEASDNTETSTAVIHNEEVESASAPTKEPEDVKEYGADDDEDEEVELEGEIDEDDEEEDEVEESEEEMEDEDSRIIPGLGDPKEAGETIAQVKIEIETSTLSVSIPSVPKKGILVPPGLWANRSINGDAGDTDIELEESIVSLQFGEDASEDSVENLEKKDDTEDKEKRSKTPRRTRIRKSVQFADGIKPGEGTSPSGCEGDMPSPPPPAFPSLNDPMRDLVKKARLRKNLRKKPKRVKLPKTKKKVKVKIIKLKKPRITPLTALMLDDSDELDDRSPPPPPPGSPPPPHLWPSYLAAYSATLQTVEATVSSPSGNQTVPPPTPLPLLVPPPPLNYTIQPLNKA